MALDSLVTARKRGPRLVNHAPGVMHALAAGMASLTVCPATAFPQDGGAEASPASPEARFVFDVPESVAGDDMAPSDHTDVAPAREERAEPRADIVGTPLVETLTPDRWRLTSPPQSLLGLPSSLPGRLRYEYDPDLLTPLGEGHTIFAFEVTDRLTLEGTSSRRILDEMERDRRLVVAAEAGIALSPRAELRFGYEVLRTGGLSLEPEMGDALFARFRLRF